MERIVSLASGDAVGGWLTEAGYDVLKFDPENPDRVHRAEERMSPLEIGLGAPPPLGNGMLNTQAVRGLLNVIDGERPDVVFPIFHGGYGENGTLQALLEWIGIPYTGSNMLASAMAMNKHIACAAMARAGVPVSEGFVVAREHLQVPEVAARIEATLGYPVVIKPVNGGSTVGLTKVKDRADLPAAVEAIREQGDDALIEVQFTGREITVAVVAGEAYPAVEIRPREGYYDYSNKYTSGRTDYLCPAPISERESRELQSSAVTAFEALGCSGFARVDFLLADNGMFVCLEVNTLPGMTTHSLVPKAARVRGEEPPALMRKIVNCALQRFGTMSTVHGSGRR